MAKAQTAGRVAVAGVVVGIGMAGVAGSALGQGTLQPPFDIPYSIVNLGTPPGVPQPLGGITFKPGDNNTLLIGGAANSFDGAIYQIGVTRNINGYITGWDGTATVLSSAQQIDGGLCVAPGSGGTLLFTTYSNNSLGQVLPGQSSPARYQSLLGVGLGGSTGTCAFVPQGYPGAGNFIVASYSTGVFGVVPLTQVGTEPPYLYDFGPASAMVSVGGGPEGIVYVPPLSPIFEETPTVLVCSYSSGRVIAYDVDANGLPVVATARQFITGLSGAEGGCLDPVTNTFLFSTFGGSGGVIAVPGFNLPPCGLADIGRTGGIPGSDGLLNNNDFVVFLNRFFAGDTRADIGVQGGIAGSDGQFDNNDFIVFIDLFFGGCP